MKEKNRQKLLEFAREFAPTTCHLKNHSIIKLIEKHGIGTRCFKMGNREEYKYDILGYQWKISNYNEIGVIKLN